MKNKEMNKETYALRKQVMALIYEIKEFAEIPRISVRVTENDGCVLGRARLNRGEIWIAEKSIKGYDLRTIVYHEIVHAVYGAEHDESCPLMKSVYSPLTKAQAKKHFLKYAKRSA